MAHARALRFGCLARFVLLAIERESMPRIFILRLAPLNIFDLPAEVRRSIWEHYFSMRTGRKRLDSFIRVLTDGLSPIVNRYIGPKQAHDIVTAYPVILLLSRRLIDEIERVYMLWFRHVNIGMVMWENFRFAGGSRPVGHLRRTSVMCVTLRWPIAIVNARNVANWPKNQFQALNLASPAGIQLCNLPQDFPNLRILDLGSYESLIDNEDILKTLLYIVTGRIGLLLNPDRPTQILVTLHTQANGYIADVPLPQVALTYLHSSPHQATSPGPSSPATSASPPYLVVACRHQTSGTLPAVRQIRIGLTCPEEQADEIMRHVEQYRVIGPACELKWAVKAMEEEDMGFADGNGSPHGDVNSIGIYRETNATTARACGATSPTT